MHIDSIRLRKVTCIHRLCLCRWTTTIVLPLKEDQLAVSLVRKFQDVRPSLLLFLHRLRSITVEDQVQRNIGE